MIIRLCYENPCNSKEPEALPDELVNLTMVCLMEIIFFFIWVTIGYNSYSVDRFLVSKASSPVSGCATIPPNKYLYLPSFISQTTLDHDLTFVLNALAVNTNFCACIWNVNGWTQDGPRKVLSCVTLNQITS